GGDERQDVLVLLDQADVPLPGQAAHLSQQFFLPVGTLDVPEENSAMLLDPRQDVGEEGRLQRVEAARLDEGGGSPGTLSRGGGRRGAGGGRGATKPPGAFRRGGALGGHRGGAGSGNDARVLLEI